MPPTCARGGCACRPAAIEQLVRVGERISVPVFEMGTSAKPADIARAGLAAARAEGYDAVIVDTAGRLQVGGGVPRCAPPPRDMLDMAPRATPLVPQLAAAYCA